jgi:hypothetical protein
MRVFVSFHSIYRQQVERLRAALAVKKPEWDFFFSPLSIAGGVFWVETLGESVAKADAFLFVASRLDRPIR